MKKHLIAAAVAGALAVPAMAQVTVSGRLDVGYTMYDAQDNTKDLSEIAYSSDTTSRITFKADEDLGGGLKAGLVLEGQIAADAGKGATTQAAGSAFSAFTRGQYLTLSGGFGTVRVGLANSVSKDTVEGFGSASDATTVIGTLHNLLSADDSRNHQVRYSTPNMSGWQAHLEVMSKDANNDETGSGSGLALAYATGPVSAQVAYRIEDTTSTQEVVQTSAGFKVGLGMLALHVLYSDIENDVAKTGENGYEVGISSKFGGGASVFASYAINEVEAASGAKTDENGMTAGIRYALSKRTNAYLIYGKTDADGSNKEVTQTAIGLVHKF
jgi:predicted porin